MSFESVQKQVNLEIFDPAQFDRSLSFSDEASMTQKSYQSTETEKEMVNDLGKIDRLIGNIENQLKFKELILKSAVRDAVFGSMGSFGIEKRPFFGFR